MYHNVSVHLLKDMWIISSYWLIKNIAVKLRYSYLHMGFTFLGKMSMSVNAGSYGEKMFSFIRNCQASP